MNTRERFLEDVFVVLLVAAVIVLLVRRRYRCVSRLSLRKNLVHPNRPQSIPALAVTVG